MYAVTIRTHLVDVTPEGSFTLNMQYFDFLAGGRKTSRRFDHLFNGPRRRPESPITQRECDLARSIQEVLEEIMLRMARHAKDLTGEPNLVMGGGVALNCVSNARLLREGPFERIWVQPAAGDAGSALGAALWAWHAVLGRPRRIEPNDRMHGAFPGPSFDPDEISSELDQQGRPHRRVTDPDERARVVAAALADGKVVGMFHGRMEFGPRALGNRFILADPRDPEMQRVLNARIKQRESFRPFAPAVLAEHAAEWFELDHESPYMLFTAPVAASRREEPVEGSTDGSIFEQLAAVRSEIPAVTHVDGSARVKTVDAARSPWFHRPLSEFHDLTGCPVLVNTSFKVRGEPIVHTPDDAYRCFISTEMDVLVLEDCILERHEQPEWDGEAVEFDLD